ncbi:GmrSD restriction endonuclease domain-containing protein [Geodermatophilus sp. CPCC 206100]|uniref:GmrSD restriction endonuclease domain-containing protein n=1 Tax=Geodermatophilus sp. CPCC 206100 TaxID=3020054 RepID=UPI003B00CD41
MVLRPRPVLRRLAAGAVALALTVGATACELLPTGGDVLADAPAGSALETLGQLEVRGRAPRTGYDRDRFGAGWVDTDRNGCDTRNDVLARDLTGETFRPDTGGCVVLSGTLDDPYSGRTIEFRRGEDTSEAVQIDHVVALSDAWQKGAQAWDEARRTAFANDPLNLLAVDGPLNQQKSDGDAATWLPPNRSYRCAYVARQVAVKAAYGLWVTAGEREAAAGVLSRCPDEPLPAGAGAAPGAGGAPVSYADCAAVRTAGAAPIRRGEPGWQDAFDGDGDGVGCE